MNTGVLLLFHLSVFSTIQICVGWLWVKNFQERFFPLENLDSLPKLQTSQICNDLCNEIGYKISLFKNSSGTCLCYKALPDNTGTTKNKDLSEPFDTSCTISRVCLDDIVGFQSQTNESASTKLDILGINISAIYDEEELSYIALDGISDLSSRMTAVYRSGRIHFWKKVENSYLVEKRLPISYNNRSWDTQLSRHFSIGVLYNNTRTIFKEDIKVLPPDGTPKVLWIDCPDLAEIGEFFCDIYYESVLSTSSKHIRVKVIDNKNRVISKNEWKIYDPICKGFGQEIYKEHLFERKASTILKNPFMLNMFGQPIKRKTIFAYFLGLFELPLDPFLRLHVFAKKSRETSNVYNILHNGCIFGCSKSENEDSLEKIDSYRLTTKELRDPYFGNDTIAAYTSKVPIVLERGNYLAISGSNTKMILPNESGEIVLCNPNYFRVPFLCSKKTDNLNISAEVTTNISPIFYQCMNNP